MVSCFQGQYEKGLFGIICFESKKTLPPPPMHAAKNAGPKTVDGQILHIDYKVLWRIVLLA
jgi:hypothetical protein